MEILLVNAPVKDSSTHTSDSPPLGLAYIASVLRQNGYEVSALDLNVSGLIDASLESILKQERPRILGISAHTQTYLSGLAIARIAKQINPGTKTIMGGTHPTVMFRDAATDGSIDIVVRGEGEYTMLELADYLIRNKGSLAEIKGIAYQKDGTLRTTTERPEITNLDQLPFPARELFPLPNYEFPGRILASRGGCPFSCHFCAVNNIWKGTRRFRNPQKVVEEILCIFKNIKNIKEIHFADDTFTLNREHVIILCDLLKKIRQAFPWRWTCSTRVDLVGRELLEKMHDAGCYFITFGVEAGSQEILNSIGKRITLEQVRKAVSECLEIGIGVHCFFMFPHPEDTKETIRAQKEFMREINNMGAGLSLSFTIPYPGTYYFEHADELGIKILSNNWDDYDGSHLIITTKNLSEQSLIESYEEISRDLGLWRMEKTTLFSKRIMHG